MKNLTDIEIQTLLESGKQIFECHRVLKKGGSNVVWELLRLSEKFYQWNHYPKGDVYDSQTHAQYYYHAHDNKKTNRLSEHGHFHLFLRTKGMPDNIQPDERAASFASTSKVEDYCHLIAISMDKQGYPIRLFTTNRWVTGEKWYDANSVCQMLDYFVIDHAWPSWPTNIWLTAMVSFYKPQIKQLIMQRDQAIVTHLTKNSGYNVFEDRKVEMLSYQDISLEEHWNDLQDVVELVGNSNIEKMMIK